MHKANVIHRDLKPENIFVDHQTKDGVVNAKIGDFGLARALTEHGAATGAALGEHRMQLDKPAGAVSAQFTGVAGTEAYMAPEVLRHYHENTRPDKLDIDKLKKQDVYQLGLILYELCRRIGSHMERNILFRKLREKRDLSDSTGKDCPLVAGKHIEHELIMLMTSEDAGCRPTVKDIQKKWLPKWDKQLRRNDHTIQESSRKINS